MTAEANYPFKKKTGSSAGIIHRGVGIIFVLPWEGITTWGGGCEVHFWSSNMYVARFGTTINQSTVQCSILPPPQSGYLPVRLPVRCPDPPIILPEKRMLMLFLFLYLLPSLSINNVIRLEVIWNSRRSEITGNLDGEMFLALWLARTGGGRSNRPTDQQTKTQTRKLYWPAWNENILAGLLSSVV